MRLDEFLARHGAARLATRADNARILEFFERRPMRTSAFDVEYRRRPDFFRLLGYQGDRAHVIVTEDGRGGINGVGTLSLRPGWVRGEPTTVGYLGDLRIGFDREILPRWRRVFGELLARAGEIDELADCTHWLTVVLDENRLARTALGPRRPGMPSLVPLAPFTMRNVLLRLPWARPRRTARRWSVRQATAADLGGLTEFFERENRRLPLGFRGELERRLAHWEGLSIDDFVYAADREGIVACVAPWSPSAAKQTVVSRVPRLFRLVRGATRVMRRPPVRVPAAGEALRIAYLTHLTFASRVPPPERAAVFRGMLDVLFERWRGADWHCMSVCDFTAWELGRALGGFVQEKVPITVYEVIPSGRTHRAGASLGSGDPPAFEMAVV